MNAIENQQIKDLLVQPRGVKFQFEAGVLLVAMPNKTSYTVHRHALNQMCSKFKLPMIYVDNLLQNRNETNDWRADLLAHNLNELFHNSDLGKVDDKHLYRTVNGEIRGFLSKRYNRHLNSATLFSAFVDAADAKGAKAYEAVVTPIRLGFKMYQPDVYEPIPDDPIAIGLEWSNSEFGAGRHYIRFSVLRLQTYASVPCEDVMSQVHIGSVMQSEGIELSAEAENADALAQQAAVKDVVNTHLNDEHLDRLLRAITMAHQEEVDWRGFKGKLAAVLQKKELESLDELAESMMEELPPIKRSPSGGFQPTSWWASALVAKLADQEKSQDRKDKLQSIGESLIPLAKTAA